MKDRQIIAIIISGKNIELLKRVQKILDCNSDRETVIAALKEAEKYFYQENGADVELALNHGGVQWI